MGASAGNSGRGWFNTTLLCSRRNRIAAVMASSPARMPGQPLTALLVVIVSVQMSCAEVTSPEVAVANERFDSG